uniref:Uncharacterized protein n=1 Tax=Chrysotila carterae TaxID=13221 RepID=A0A7S4BZ37_CHRCT
MMQEMALTHNEVLERLRNAGETLKLVCGEIGDEGCKALAEGLKTNQALTSIDLSKCDGIGDEGCKALAEGLKTNQALTSINLTNCLSIGDEGCKALAEGLKTNQALTSI